MIEYILNEELEKIKKSIGVFPYLFIVSNEEKIKDFFITNIANLNEINQVYSIDLTNNELRKKLEDIKGILYIENNNENANINNSLYYALVAKREVLWDNQKTIITILNEETSISLLSANQSLATASWFYFIDDIVKENQYNKKLIKK